MIVTAFAIGIGIGIMLGATAAISMLVGEGDGG
jgi:hypothetical protein